MTTQQLEQQKVVYRWKPTEEDAEAINCKLWYEEYVLITETAFVNGTGLMLYVMSGGEWYIGTEADCEAVIWKLMQERRQFQFALQLAGAPDEIVKHGARLGTITDEDMEWARQAVEKASTRPRQVTLTQKEAGGVLNSLKNYHILLGMQSSNTVQLQEQAQNIIELLEQAIERGRR